MRKLSLKAGRTGMMCGVVLFQVACGAALAGTADLPSSAGAPAAAGEAAKDSGPFGGCEPLGMTASGELVFPLECKHVLHKTSETPLATDEKAGAASEAPAEGKSSDMKSSNMKSSAPEDKAAVTPEKSSSADKAAAVDSKSAAVEAKPDAKPAAMSASGKAAVADTGTAVEQKAPEKAGSKKASRAARVNALAAVGAKQVAMAKPAQLAVAGVHVENKAPVRTAGMPACMHFRSYNPTSKSYLAYDGHTYACR